MTRLSRRQFGAITLAGSAAAATAPAPSTAAERPQVARPFPPGFRWGAATAAYQIEGAPHEDGKGLSIWDVFSHTPGKIKDGSTGDIACDSYHLYTQDRQALQNIGANAYRFSISWPRIFPDGAGSPNMKGVDHYKRVIDDLLAHGIEPYVTLYHWDLPAALPNDWRNRQTAYRFGDYAGYIAGQLSDRVKHFMTTNEIGTFLSSGYLFGDHAPGLRLPLEEVNVVRHHALLAHGLGVQAIRASAARGARVGLAENPRIPVPVIETPEHVAASAIALKTLNNAILGAILEGSYSAQFLQTPHAADPIQPGDMAIIGSPLDFVGLNVYSGVPVRADPGPAGFAVVPQPSSAPQMMLPWLTVQPESLYWGMRLISDVWKPKALYVTENGCPSADTLTEGHVYDTDRVTFLRQYLTQLQRATREGYPVEGYFVWSLLDNFEWAEGFTARFGVNYTDYATQRRIPKLSAAWFKALTSTDQLV